LWLLPSTAVGQLPVLAKLHRDASPAMSFERDQNPSIRLVIRLWPTSYRFEAANHLPMALWIGMVSLERLEHPANMVTLARTDQDFDLPTAQLAQSLQSQSLHLNIKRRDATPVLLVR
jgi:hypothetical protein